MKGSLSVSPIFSPFKIHRGTVYLKSPLVAIDHTSLHLNNISIPWDHSRTIINCTYSYEYQCLLLLCDDWKLYIYNKNLQQISKLINWESKYTVGFQLIEEVGIILMIGVGEIQIVKVNINTNIKKTKFLSSVKFIIEKKQVYKQDQKSKSKLKWNKGYGYDIKNNLLFLWSLQDINFYSLSKLQLKSQIRNVVKKQQPITFVYFNNSYKYTVTGLINGNVKVWRLPLFVLNNNNSTRKQTNPSQYILIHTCIFHTKQVQKIVATYDDRVIISQSTDLTVCLWSLQTFELLRYTKVMLFDHKVALAVKENVLGELKFGKTMEFVMELDSKIVMIDKKYEKMVQIGQNNNKQNKILQTQLTLSSNMGIQITSSNFSSKDLNKIDIQLFYPPLKSQQILQIISCPFNCNQYYLLSQIGKIYKLRIENNSSIIQYCYNVSSILDSQNHTLNQIPTVIKFWNGVPVEYDSQIIQVNGGENMGNGNGNSNNSNNNNMINNINNNNNNNNSININNKSKINIPNNSPSTNPPPFQSPTQKFVQLQLLAIGLNKGSIIFLPISSMSSIFTRITYHRQQIRFIQSVYHSSIQNSILVSVCSQNYMKFVKFDQNNNKANCFRSIYLGEKVKIIKGFEQNMVVGMDGGKFDVFMWIQNLKQCGNTIQDNSNNISNSNNNNTNAIKIKRPSPLSHQQSQQFNLYTYQNPQCIQHEGQILSIDICICNKLLLTAGTDNKIKIWTYYKVHLYQIHLDQGLKYAIFSNNYQIIVSHNQKLLYIRDYQFKITQQERQKYNDEIRGKYNLLELNQILERENQQKNKKENQMKGQFYKEEKVERKNYNTNYNNNIDEEYQIIKLKAKSSFNHKNKGNSGQKNTYKSDKDQLNTNIHNKTNNNNNKNNTNISFHSGGSVTSRKRSQLKRKSSSLVKQKQRDKTLSGSLTYRQPHRQKQLNYYPRQIDLIPPPATQKPSSLLNTSDIDQTKRHLQDLLKLKNQINKPLLPRITPKKQDIFEQFMKAKLLNKKILTRRDITLNRIIMNNIVKDNIGESTENLAGLKLEF